MANQEDGGGNARLLIFGGLMALVVLFLPKGILPTVKERLLERRKRGRAGLVGARLDGPLVIPDRTAPATNAGPGEPLLEVKGLAKHFGGIKAVDMCSFSVPQGSITALIGPNGAGKTTAFNLIHGTMPPTAGEVWFDGRRIDGLPPYRRAHLGIGRTFQITRLFREMTVLENVVAPVRTVRQLNLGAVFGEEAKRAMELLEVVGMDRFRDMKAGELLYGQQNLVELAQVLMLDRSAMSSSSGVGPVFSPPREAGSSLGTSNSRIFCMRRSASPSSCSSATRSRSAWARSTSSGPACEPPYAAALPKHVAERYSPHARVPSTNPATSSCSPASTLRRRR